MRRTRTTPIRREGEEAEEAEVSAKQRWQNMRTKFSAANVMGKSLSSIGYRQKSSGEYVADSKINRILKNFGNMGTYQTENEYYGWSGMKPIYEMEETIDQIDYNEIFLFGENLIFKDWNHIPKATSLPTNIKYIDIDGNIRTRKQGSSGIEISVENGLRLRRDLINASNSKEKPLIFVMATHAHVMLKVTYRGNIFSIGYGHPAEDHKRYRKIPNKFATAIETSLSKNPRTENIMEADDFHGRQGVLWSTDYIPPGDNHAVKTIWVDYLNHSMAKRLDKYLQKVRHVGINMEYITVGNDTRYRISNQTELYLDNSVYSTLAGHIPAHENGKNCIIWAGEILGRTFNCGLTYAPKYCKSIPDHLIAGLYTDQKKFMFDDTPFYYSFNDTFLKKAQDSVKPSILTQIGRHPKAACAMCGATACAMNGVCDDVETLAAKTAAGAVVGAATVDCCEKGAKALLGESCPDGAVCRAPPPQTMVRSGGKTHKRKKKKQNRRKTKKRNRKKTNKHKKRQINIKRLNHKRKFKKKTRKTII